MPEIPAIFLLKYIKAAEARPIRTPPSSGSQIEKS
jgi:hypothetical protein